MSGVISSAAMRMAKSAAAMASWMKRPIFFSSFLGIQFSGIEIADFGGDAAIERGGVKLRDGADAALPASSFCQTCSVPMPRAQTRPTPVTTTRRLNVRISP